MHATTSIALLNRINTINTTATLLTSLEPLKHRLQNTQIVWVGVSGGLDSCVLLDLAAKTLPQEQLRVIHINHQLSTQANQWEAHVAQLTACLFIHI